MNPTNMIGAHTNCNPEWNQLLTGIDNGLYGLQLIARKIILQYIPERYQTEEVIEDLTQDAVTKVYVALKDTGLVLHATHPGPLVTVIMRNEILRQIPRYVETIEHVELEPDMVTSRDNLEARTENIELIKRIREHATEKESKVISKIIQGITINHAERQALYRLRARLEKQGVQAA